MHTAIVWSDPSTQRKEEGRRKKEEGRRKKEKPIRKKEKRLKEITFFMPRLLRGNANP
jgi:hypothetical protein